MANNLVSGRPELLGALDSVIGKIRIAGSRGGKIGNINGPVLEEYFFTDFLTVSSGDMGFSFGDAYPQGALILNNEKEFLINLKEIHEGQVIVNEIMEVTFVEFWSADENTFYLSTPIDGEGNLFDANGSFTLTDVIITVT